MLFRVRVVSYNVLSSHLASPLQYPALDPNHLNAANRLPVVFQKLEEQLLQSSTAGVPVVVCLQEVSYDWAGAFHTWFANRGYHLVTGLYGKKYNGYMGVALAYPTASFETVQVRIDRLSDTRSWPRPPPTDVDAAPPPSLFARLVKQTQSILQTSTRKFLGVVTNSLAAITNGGNSSSSSNIKKEEVIDHWQMSENRHNVLLCATLKDRATGQAFCIGNYHMPCAFFAPMVMTIHADLAARHVQDCAIAAAVAATAVSGSDSIKNNNDDDDDVGETAATTTTAATTESLPYILAGDWNIKPDSATYRMLTTGQLDATDPTFPSPKLGMHWSVSSRHAMKSAYATASSNGNGQEPDFTNYACQRDDPDNHFIDTLDYIFLSDQWKVTHVKPIPHRSEAKGPFPNLDHGEPSDHVLIAADLEIDQKS